MFNGSKVRAISWVALLSFGIVGCFGGGTKACVKTQEYHASQEVPPMQIPEDLDEPDRSRALVIPGEPSAEIARVLDGTCLDLPPNYFDKEL